MLIIHVLLLIQTRTLHLLIFISTLLLLVTIFFENIGKARAKPNLRNFFLVVHLVVLYRFGHGWQHAAPIVTEWVALFRFKETQLPAHDLFTLFGVSFLVVVGNEVLVAVVTLG